MLSLLLLVPSFIFFLSMSVKKDSRKRKKIDTKSRTQLPTIFFRIYWLESFNDWSFKSLHFTQRLFNTLPTFFKLEWSSKILKIEAIKIFLTTFFLHISIKIYTQISKLNARTKNSNIEWILIQPVVVSTIIPVLH